MRVTFAPLVVTIMLLSTALYRHPLLLADQPSPPSDTPEVPAVSDQAVVTETEKKLAPPLNLALKTAGGTQLWTDHLHRNGYPRWTDLPDHQPART